MRDKVTSVSSGIKPAHPEIKNNRQLAYYFSIWGFSQKKYQEAHHLLYFPLS